MVGGQEPEAVHDVGPWGRVIFMWCAACQDGIPLADLRAHRQWHGEQTALEVDRWLRGVVQ